MDIWLSQNAYNINGKNVKLMDGNSSSAYVQYGVEPGFSFNFSCRIQFKNDVSVVKSGTLELSFGDNETAVYFVFEHTDSVLTLSVIQGVTTVFTTTLTPFSYNTSYYFDIFKLGDAFTIAWNDTPMTNGNLTMPTHCDWSTGYIQFLGKTTTGSFYIVEDMQLNNHLTIENSLILDGEIYANDYHGIQYSSIIDAPNIAEDTSNNILRYNGDISCNKIKATDISCNKIIVNGNITSTGDISANKLYLNGIAIENTNGTITINGDNLNGFQKVYTINLSAQNNTVFYPVRIDNAPTMYTHYFSIEMPSQGGNASYNMHSLHAVVRGGGWSDQNTKYEIYHDFYQNGERSILGIYGGTQNFVSGIVVYLRGGQTYTILSNSKTVQAYTNAVTLDNSVFALKNVDGIDISGVSSNITMIWSGINQVAGKVQNNALTVYGQVEAQYLVSPSNVYFGSALYYNNGTHVLRLGDTIDVNYGNYGGDRQVTLTDSRYYLWAIYTKQVNGGSWAESQIWYAKFRLVYNN